MIDIKELVNESETQVLDMANPQQAALQAFFPPTEPPPTAAPPPSDPATSERIGLLLKHCIQVKAWCIRTCVHGGPLA